MNWKAKLLVALGLLLTPAWGQPLGARILEITRNPRFEGSQWGIQVVSLDTGRILFDQNGGRFLVPASNAKLFTSAMALCRLGRDFRIRTSLYGPRPGPGGVVKGDLILFGRGDPTFLPRNRDHAVRPDPLESLATQAAAAGVKVVEGDVVGDESFFRTRPYGSGWEAEDRAFAYGADVSALTVHENMVTLRVYPGPAQGRPCFLFPMPGQGLLPMDNRTVTGAAADLRAEWEGDALVVTGALPRGSAPASLNVPVRDPARFAARLLRRALERHGIVVKGGTRAVHAFDRPRPLATAALDELAHLDSPPLQEIVRETLKDSVNLDAQLLLLQMGGSEEEGLKALQAFLAEAGVRPGDVLLEEGSGLSRKDLVKPRALTALLRYMRSRPEAAAFEAALPVAGVDGTLRDRLLETPALGVLRAKTGTLKYTSALSGYLRTPVGETLAFSILLNGYAQQPGQPSPQESVDAVAAALALEGRVPMAF